MPTPKIAHPPTPRGATTRELQTIAHLHRAATVEHEEGEMNPAAGEMLAGVALIVELIDQRNRGRAFHEAIDDHNEHAG